MVHNSFFRGRQALAITFGAVTVAAITYGVQAAAGTPDPAQSSCRASLLRISGGGQAFEPVVANKSGTPCATEDAGGSNVPGNPPLPVDLKILYAQTNAAGSSRAGVADLVLHLSALNPQLPDVAAQVLTSRADITCNGTTPVMSGSSRVLGVEQVGGQGVIVPPGDAPASAPPNPLISINANEQTTTTTTLTQRALHIVVLPGTANIDIVVAESVVDLEGSPCGTPPTTQPPTTTPPTTQPPTSGAVGWMNGGGLTGTTVVQHAFVLPCTTTQKHPGPNLTVHLPDGQQFKLTKLSDVRCSTEPAAGDPEQPDAGFNTISGHGEGTCNGHPKVDIAFSFTDGGEPNKGRDKDSIQTDSNSKFGCHADVAGPTTNGNQQAHKGNNPPA